MSKIIKFPGRDKPSEFINPDLRAALNKLEPNLRRKVENIIDSTAQKYRFVCDSVEISLPPGTTDEQLDPIKQLIDRQRAAIVELVNELIDSRVLHQLHVHQRP